MNKPHGAGRWRRLSMALGACIVLVLTLSACAGEDAELNTLEPKGTYSRSIDICSFRSVIIAIVVLFFVLGAVLYMWFRFRVNEHVEGEWPVQNHGNTKLEITWTIIPLVILVIISVPSLAVLQKVNSDVERQDMTVVVVGQQWWWEFRYYLGDNAANYDPKVDKLDGREPDVVTAGQLVMPDWQRRPPRRHLARRHPFVLDPGAQRQARRGARVASSRGRSRPTTPACTSASAPSSAACPTRACACRRSR